ncbi:MAG TPA: MFS transporter [Geobacteraceae bacterium]|nr:MFS transporter [Geobacteraceae bacterium]
MEKQPREVNSEQQQSSDGSGERGSKSGFFSRERLRLLVRAFRYRNYRLYFIGQTLSLMGTWMQLIAVGWLVYRLTGSALYLGVVAFAGQISTLVLTPFAGLLSDRMNRRRLLLWTQSLALVQALTLALVVLSGSVRIWQVAVLSLLNGVINSFDMPARHSFVADLIPDREDFANAIPLNSAMFNSARLVGPSLAGILIAHFGEGFCFLVNAVSYLAILACLKAMRLPAGAPGNGNGKRVLIDVADGFRYAWHFFAIRQILLLICLLSLTVMPYVTLLPAFAREFLNADPLDYGLMVTVSGIGCLVCNVAFAFRRNVIGLDRIIPFSAVIIAICLAAFTFCRSLALSFPILFCLGGISMAQLTASNIILQTVVDDDKRGRIMSFYIMSFMGMMPLGGLLAGAVAERFGVAETLLAGSGLYLAGTLLFLHGFSRFRGCLLPVFEKLGIGRAGAG